MISIKKEANALSHFCVVRFLFPPVKLLIFVACHSLKKAVAGFHFAIGQLIPMVTAVKACSMCLALSEKYSLGCTTQAQSQESMSCMTTF